MSLLAAVNQPSGNPTATGAPQYYFALDSTPADPIVTAEGFDAIGDGTPTGVGSYNANGNGTAPFPAEMYTLSTSAGTPQFSMGLLNVPTGVGSVGNDFAISRYDDNGGYQGAQLTITRSTGLVSIANSLSVASDISCNTAGVASALTVGTAATVGGGSLEINGTLGVGTVFDSVYNPAIPSQTAFTATGSAVLPNAPGAGTTAVPLGSTFTVPRSGMYILTGLISYDGSVGTTFTAAPEDFFSVICSPSPPGPGAFGGVTVSLTNSTATDRSWEATATLLLTAAVPYQATLRLQNESGTLAATGAAVLNGSFDLVALC
jgi:hypothetical protein